MDKNLLQSNLNEQEKASISEWIYKPGLSKEIEIPHSDRFTKVEVASTQFVLSGRIDSSETKKWSSHECLHFLRFLPTKADKDQMAELDAMFNFTKSGNSEILFEFLLLSINKQYLPAFESLEEFLMHNGRRKFVLPLFKSLNQTSAGKELATKIFAKSKFNYNAVTRQSVEALFAEK